MIAFGLHDRYSCRWRLYGKKCAVNTQVIQARPRGIRSITAGVIVALMALSVTAVAPPAVAATAAGGVTIASIDLSDGLPAGWTAAGNPTVDDVFEFGRNGLAWQGVPVDPNNAGAPHVGDEVFGEVDLTLWGDVDAAETVLLRLTDGRNVLAEWKDLTTLPRGKRITVATAALSAPAVLDAVTTDLMVELHNDTAGTVDVSTVRLWGMREGSRVDYAVPGADFNPAAQAWKGEKTTPRRDLVLGANDSLTRVLPVGSPAAPHSGDTLTATAQVARDAGSTSATFATIDAGARGTMTAAPGDAWNTVTSQAITVAPSATEVTVTVHGDATDPVRLRSFSVDSVPSTDPNDFNADGTVDAKDLAWLRDRIASGGPGLRGDVDRDGELTRADADAYARLVLDDRSVVFANLDHLNFLSEEYAIDGRSMIITRLYSEPNDRADLSAGYHWVGDPQEGIAAVDDVARSAIAYAEHFALYGDAHSYDQMAGNLEFVLWMRTAQSDYNNFVVPDGSGGLKVKDSASSRASFGYWAARAYEALATAQPLLRDGDLADRVDVALSATAQRMSDLLNTTTAGDGGDGLRSDMWLQAIAMNGAATHFEHASGADRRTITDIARILGSRFAAAQSGDFTTYPLGSIRNAAGTWDEWGSVQTQALAHAAVITGEKAWLASARLSADSFLSDLLISGRSAALAPNKNAGTQINYGTASYVENYLTLFEITGDRAYADMAGVAAAWWLGNNRLDVEMFDQASGVAFDAIDANGLNSNGGAESVVEALRGILRVVQVPEALAMMTSTLSASTTTTTIEFEDLAREGRPADGVLTLPDGALNAPSSATRTQAATSGVDEAKVHADAQQFSNAGPTYGAWSGEYSLFVTGNGYNNMRIFDGGDLTQDVPLSALPGVAAGDALSLAFAANVQFDTNLDVTVEAIVPGRDNVLLADDSGFAYHPRTWYSGASAVRTTVVAPVPAGATAIRITFAVEANATNAHEGYATVTEATLSVLGAPAVRFGSSAFSASSYARFAADSTAAFDVPVATAGEHNLFVSSYADVDGGLADAGSLTLMPAASHSAAASSAFSATINTSGPAKTATSSETASVAIKHVGSTTLSAGPTNVAVAIGPDGAASLDALVLYPARTSATYTLLDGTERMILRDATHRVLRTGTPAELAVTPPSPSPSTPTTTPPPIVPTTPPTEPSTDPSQSPRPSTSASMTPTPTSTDGPAGALDDDQAPLAVTGSPAVLGWVVIASLLVAAGVGVAWARTRRRTRDETV